MSAQELITTANAMVADGKGILAMDESTGTCTKRFEKLGIKSTDETRRQYRELLLTTPQLSDYVSGAILYDETIRQTVADGSPFPVYISEHGILPGIKVDTGAKPHAGFPGETITEGLDGLRERLAEYRQLGAKFCKWRAVITIGDGTPARGNIQANAHALARYAALCQEASLAPIVEPEVLIDGDHTIERCYDVTIETLHTVFDQLFRQRILFAGMVLKPSMVIPGKACPQKASVQQVAEMTLDALIKTVPAGVAGVAFLSGGQSNEEATAHLNAMNLLKHRAPWPLTFSYARALQQPALELWKGNQGNVAAAQKALHHRARLNSAASRGRYNEKLEKEAA